MSSSIRFVSPSLFFLLWIFFVHLAGIYLFTSGFLLTRLALTNVTACNDGSCTLPPTHKRAIVLIIDSLRFDFIAPAPYIPSENNAEYSVHHHLTLTLPSLLTDAHPRNSFIFNSYPDPPTVTLQRIKGLTTGSLPTFVDIGSSFGGSEIEEDSIIGQVGMNGKEAAFIGDDTWMNVFPNAFHVNMTWPYDSFNVEDLHTVDNGVITHLFPLLESGNTPDLIIGHFLGVDHVGHRVGPYHHSMHSKLLQMNATLTRVVDSLSDDTLLVVLGDHGMDRAGDHGGDGQLETSAGVWIYSKSIPLCDDEKISNKIPSQLLPYTTFPDADSPHRYIQQIDLVPTLSLLLGLPIPFGNLGTVIPELFWRQSNPPQNPTEESWGWGSIRKTAVKDEDRSRASSLIRALRLNALQIHTYLDTYRLSSSGAELDDAWLTLESAWNGTHVDEELALVNLWDYTRLALSSCRSIWAQFNPLLMVLGLVLFSASLLSTYSVYSGIGKVTSSHLDPATQTTVVWEDWLIARMWQALRGLAAGSTLGFLASLTYETQLKTFGKGMDSLDCILFMAPFVSCVMVGKLSLSKILGLLPPMSNILKTLPFVLHAISFFSNSFTFWEDRIIAFLLPSSLIPHVFIGLRAPTARLRRRILGFTGLLVVCIRLMAVSTVCREEQHPYCHVTFYSSLSSSSALESTYTSTVVPPSASSSSAPTFAVIGAPLMAILLPIILSRCLKQSKSDQGLATVWFNWIMTPSLFCGSVYWLIEYVETAGLVDESEWGAVLRFCRTFLSRAALGWSVVVGGVVWWKHPLCISIETSEGQRQIKILGFANAYGAPYMLFWTIPFSAVWATTQLTGQIVLGLSAIALMSYLEIIDGIRDVLMVEEAFTSNRLSDILPSGDDFALGATQNNHSPNVKFYEITPVILLAMHLFFRTGHQSTIPSIQWKSSFLLTSTLTYPWAGTFIINTLGPIWVILTGVGLVGVWLKGPRFSSVPSPKETQKDSQQSPPVVSADDQIQLSILLCSLCVSMYLMTILLTTSLSASILRRHLMVWKVFAPRWILGTVVVLVGDVSLLMVYVGAWQVRRVVERTFSRMMGQALT
ncbi:hypothetical protein BDP27DRAFT_1329173 [Rhodocollybia butyracea]|uniref:GPI ethanolamine phosphate transferase 3 n=1 Tax=Rhodocollybia butyracea TaxID=206335 RepID=A0A9P5U5Y3_9AGAR|nr:hypothetical protein BDP27DRAFT_1329173 [Rhodocollybia butyracea]